MKKQIALLTAFLLLSLTLFSANEQAALAAITAGDCNGSGSITAGDITAARGHLYDNDGSYPSACDANEDNALTVADLHCIRRLADGDLCQSVNWDARLGTNLNAIVDFSPEYTFINAFKSSRTWTTRLDWGEWGANQPELLDLDEDGYAMSLPTESNPPYRFISTFLFKDIGGNYPGGVYHVYFDGAGTIGYGGDATVNWGASSAGHHVLNVTPSNSGIELTISQTDPAQTGDYIRNIRIMHEDFSIGDETTQLFHPDFIESVTPFKTLRFMDWMRTNFSTQGARSADGENFAVDLVDPDGSLTPYATLVNGHVVNTGDPSDTRAIAERPSVSDAQYSTDKGAPVEIMVELANQVNSDPWFNMPHLATDAYVSDFATYVRDNLEPSQRVYVEYSNEIWNTIFTQFWWITDQGKAEWPNSSAIDQAKQLNWYGKRSNEVCAIWDQVFGSEQERVVCLVNMQASNTQGASWLVQQVLDCPLRTQATCDQHIDAIAIAPYIGNYLANQNSLIKGWLADGQASAMNKLFAELTAGGQVPGQSGSAVALAAASMDTYADLAANRGMDLISYEGGQHLHSSDPEVNPLFLAASNDPRMEQVYASYLSAWPTAGSVANAGGKQFLHFNNTSKYGASGAWGSQESYSDPARPKQDALLAYNAAAACDWDDCDSLPTTISAEITLSNTLATSGTNSVPVNLASNSYDVSEVAFALDYDTAQLSYTNVVLAGGLSADFTLNASHNNGIIQVSIYPLSENAKSLPDGELMTVTLQQVDSSTGQGLRFVVPQAGSGSTMQPTTCGNDFGQAIACESSGVALINSSPTAVVISGQLTVNSNQWVGLALIVVAGLTGWVGFGRRMTR